MTPRFTVSIPTYNRADILRDTLAQVCLLVSLHQNQVGEEIEVLTIDNASTDQTHDICREFAGRYGFFRFIRNTENIGLIQNIRKAIVSAQSEYVWTLGDDDYPAPWCMTRISQVITYAEAHSIDHPFQLYSLAYATPDFRLSAQRSSAQPIQLLSPGCSILAEETIHGIALISRWVFVRKYWDDDYFDQVYLDSDIYTFVNVMLRAALQLPALIIASPVAIASDRGSRAYYHPKTAIARVIEFPQIENLVLAHHGMRQGRKLLACERKNWLGDRVPFLLKLNVLRDEYANVQKWLQRPISLFWQERMLHGFIRWLTTIPLLKRWLLKKYRQRKTTS